MKKLFSAFAKVFIAVLTAVLLLALYLNISTLQSIGKIMNGKHVTSGYFTAIVSSGSMEPSVSVNDLLLVKADMSYQAGDIITYVVPQGALVTHRVKTLTDNGYITQGDANNIIDEEVSERRVLGRVVFALPGVGGIIDGMVSPVGIVLLVCLFVLWFLIQWIRRKQNEDA